ncbi:MAG: DUF5615 family PIN-like protein [Planctomycetes bacterium]|nr:DUF5615 family PIN-like protein [Planctomycetota bacterium]
MKLLFDQNLSPRLAQQLDDVYPGSSHVSDHGLDRAIDLDVWNFARDNNFILVSKDADFSDLSTLIGFPPKVIWLRSGNCSTATIESVLRSNCDAVESLVSDLSAGILALW